MDRSVIASVVLDQQKFDLTENHVSRSNNFFDSGKEILVLSGIRRCGKSTYLQEIRSSLSQNNYYLNFDDDRLVQFTIEDFQQLYEIFIEHYGYQTNFFFDEIQNITGWERFVRRLRDNGNKVYITGSNASMLSKELGTHLTGRYYQHELYPFSFAEFIKFKKKTVKSEDVFTTQGRAEIKQLYNEYFDKGGFPGFLQSGRREYLKTLYESILYRDVIVRNGLTNEKELLELIYFLASNVTKLASYNSLAKVIGVKNATTVKNYLEYIQNTYLIFAINKYDFSLKSQIQNPKKFYFIDNALVKELGFFTSDDKGRLLENLVFIELKRRAREVYYHKSTKECDFVIKEKNKIIEAIQVCWSVYNPETKAREIAGLSDALNSYGLIKGTILTDSEEDNLKVNGFEIEIKPVWKWLLESINL
jgi:uncharacterized protein